MKAPERTQKLLRVVKVVRLVRVVIAMTRLQRSRERYRRLKMVGLSTPVERVFELIKELQAKGNLLPEDNKSLVWTMDLIAKEELYKVDEASSSGVTQLSAEMTDWLRSNLQVPLHGRPRAQHSRGIPNQATTLVWQVPLHGVLGHKAAADLVRKL